MSLLTEPQRLTVPTALHQGTSPDPILSGSIYCAGRLDPMSVHGANPSYPVGPLAGDNAFPPLFKILHGISNHLGISPINEAFRHHPMVRICGLQQSDDQVARTLSAS